MFLPGILEKQHKLHIKLIIHKILNRLFCKLYSSQSQKCIEEKLIQYAIILHDGSETHSSNEAPLSLIM